MPRTPRAVHVNSTSSMLQDDDWITIIGALVHDRHPQGRRLSALLLRKSKPGRHVRLLRFIRRRQPTLNEMRREMRVSRRTIFRYLNSLEAYGMQFHLGGAGRYQIDVIPERLKRLL